MPQSEKRSQPLTSELLDTEVTQRQTSGYKWMFPQLLELGSHCPNNRRVGSRWEPEGSVLSPLRPVGQQQSLECELSVSYCGSLC